MGPVVAKELCHWHTTGLFTLICLTAFSVSTNVHLLLSSWQTYPVLQRAAGWQSYVFSSAACCKITMDFYFYNNFFATFSLKVLLDICRNHHLQGAKEVTATLQSNPCNLFRCLFFCQDCALCRSADPTQILQCGTWMKFRENHVTSADLMHCSDFQHLSPPLPLHFRKVFFWVWHRSGVGRTLSRILLNF